MKIINIPLCLFEAGDYVSTYGGAGIVVSTDFTYHDDGTIWFYNVHVQHKSGDENNVSNTVQEVDGFTSVRLITKEEYDAENY